jgi:PadR family transcriptional regulator, regulatory protein PadR
MPHPSRDLLHGTLDLLILSAVRDAPRHGYEIVRHIENTTHSAVVIEDGSLYPALYRLEKKRHIKGEWGVKGGRRARFYRLTDAGQKALAARSDNWTRFAAGVARLLLGERS